MRDMRDYPTLHLEIIFYYCSPLKVWFRRNSLPFVINTMLLPNFEIYSSGH